jgi:hypothetical protein
VRSLSSTTWPSDSANDNGAGDSIACHSRLGGLSRPTTTVRPYVGGNEFLHTRVCPSEQARTKTGAKAKKNFFELGSWSQPSRQRIVRRISPCASCLSVALPKLLPAMRERNRISSTYLFVKHLIEDRPGYGGVEPRGKSTGKDRA